MLKVPTQILNECLNRLVLMELITTLRPVSGTSATEYLYQPARPLNRISLNEFKNLDDNRIRDRRVEKTLPSQDAERLRDKFDQFLDAHP
jgi:membrane protein